MTREEAEKYAENMTYREAIYNLKQAKSVPYRKATFIKVYELLDELEQEPFMNKPCISSKVCEHDKEVVLDKIRAEIKEKFEGCDICEWLEDYDYEENNISEYQSVGDIEDILQIIDKYKTESEVQDGND